MRDYNPRKLARGGMGPPPPPPPPGRPTAGAGGAPGAFSAQVSAFAAAAPSCPTMLASGPHAPCQPASAAGSYASAARSALLRPPVTATRSAPPFSTLCGIHRQLSDATMALSALGCLRQPRCRQCRCPPLALPIPACAPSLVPRCPHCSLASLLSALPMLLASLAFLLLPPTSLPP